MSRTDLGGFSGRSSEAVSSRHLLVRAGHLSVALRAEVVVEILDSLTATRLPGAPPEVVGLINHRGSPVTLLDLGAVLAGRPVSPASQHRIVVVRWRSQRIALAVDDVVALGAPSDPVGLTILDLDALLGPIF